MKSIQLCERTEISTEPEKQMIQVWELSVLDFKQAIVSVLSISKENNRQVHKHIGNFSKEMESLRKCQMDTIKDLTKLK